MECFCDWLGAGGKWMRGLGLGFTNPVGTGGVCDVCLCMGFGCVGGVGLDPGLEGWCYVWVCCEFGRLCRCTCILC